MNPKPSTGLADRPALPLVLLLAAAYFLLGRLALLLAIPPGFASSVWPAGGVALLGLLVGGRRLWPGVLLGSFLVNFPMTYAGAGGLELLRAVSVAAVIGGGATLQAIAGSWAIGRWVGFPSRLSESRDILRFLALGGPVSCLVSATVGVATLAAGGLIELAEVTFHWWTWWVGDTIGVLVTVPLLLSLFGASEGVWRERRRRVGIPLGVTTAAVVLLFVFERGQERRQLELELGQRAMGLAHAFEKQTDRSLDDLVSLEALFAASDLVSRADFRSFAGRILERNPTFQALSWNPRVRHAERPAYEAAGRADGFAGYQVTERAAEGLRPAAERPEYVVVHYIEPYAGNEPALGYDIASDASRRTAVERARDSGRPAATPGIRLVQETGEQTGVLILMPVYAGGSRPETVAERRRTLRGYATGVLRVGDALQAALARLPREEFEVTLVDRSAPGGGELLASLERGPRRESRELFSWSFDRRVGGRLWSLRLAVAEAALAGQRRWQAWLVLAGGLILVSLLGVLLLVQTGRAHELAELNARLAEGIERRRRLEEQREKLIGELELRNAELERFSYTVSHDLKSPLTTIKGFLGLLEKDLEAGRRDKVKSEIERLHQSADRMRQLVDDLLSLSRAGQVKAPAEGLELDDVVREALVHVEGSRIAAEVEIEVAPDLPRVSANRGQLLEVLQNLLDNAIKFTAGCSGARIEIGATVRGSQVVCHVRDNGIGIGRTHHERIFGLFSRLDPEREGTGLGLALVRRILETSGGSIWVESEGEGKGSTFFFTLPAG